MMDNRVWCRLPLLGFSLLALELAGCQMVPDKAMSRPADQVIYTGFRRPPRVRYGAYPMAVLGTPLVGPNLGAHSYYFSLAEKDGVAYTCRAGHVDIIHVRIAADWTAYLVAETYRHLMNHDPGFSYRLAVDPSRGSVRLTYPANWNRLPPTQRSAVAREVAFAVGPYLTFTMATWHEMVTWFGFRSAGLPSEFPSAFSWEDSYSNLLGTIVAVQALQDSRHSYNQAVAIAIDKEMQKLGIQPVGVTKRASELIKNDWYTGNTVLFVDIKMRNFDIGLGDGYITPTLVPGVGECPDAEPLSYPVPTLDALAEHGFALSLEIEPHEWERSKVLRVVYGDEARNRVTPELHFARIMDYICQKAAAKWGPQYGAAQQQQQQALYTAK